MRGKVLLYADGLPQLGITPAHAGKSVSAEINRTGKKDHPRTCGEKYLIFCIDFVFVGSPPRMRGKAAASHPEERTEGITPAYAGKSFPFD